MSEPCLICGRTPTADVRFQGMHGVADTPSWYEVSGPFCRDCGIATFRNATEWQLANTMRSGQAILWMPSVLFANLGARRRVGRLDPPGHPSFVATPLERGRPLLLRGRIAMALVPIAVLVVGIAALMHANSGGSSPIKVGSCMQVSGDSSTFTVAQFSVSTAKARVVPCSGPHNATVVAKVSDPSMCPGVHAGSILADDNRYFCVTPA